MNELIKNLTNRGCTDTVQNFYTHGHLVRNLELYFDYLTCNRPEFALIGEAPGYKGCALTGIPFTSEHILKNNNNIFFERYQGELCCAGLGKEGTAKYVWGSFNKNEVPLFWNSFPFHPHKKGDIKTNRRPTIAEISEGCSILRSVLKLIKPKCVIAVGRSAQKSFDNVLPEILIHRVRHPSFGGASEYGAKIKAKWCAALSIL